MNPGSMHGANSHQASRFYHDMLIKAKPYKVSCPESRITMVLFIAIWCIVHQTHRVLVAGADQRSPVAPPCGQTQELTAERAMIDL